MNILKYRRTLSFSLVAVFGVALGAPVTAIASESGRRNTALALGAAALVLATKKNKTPALAAAVGAAVAYKRYDSAKKDRQEDEWWRYDRNDRSYNDRYNSRTNDRRDDRDYRDNDRRNDSYSRNGRYDYTSSNRDRYGNTYSSRDRFGEWAGRTVDYSRPGDYRRDQNNCDNSRKNDSYRRDQSEPPHGDYSGYYRDSRGSWVKKPVVIHRDDSRPDNRSDKNRHDDKGRDRYNYKVADRH